jgi:hypothetical protein
MITDHLPVNPPGTPFLERFGSAWTGQVPTPSRGAGKPEGDASDIADSRIKKAYTETVGTPTA